MEPIRFDTGSGPLAEVLRERGSDPVPRPAQQRFADAVEHCIAARVPGFLDAETGVGKGLGYLIPTLTAAGQRRDRPLVLVSTATVALQRQLIAQDIPLACDAIERAGRRRPVAALRVGKAQIIDPERLDAAIVSHAGDEDEDVAARVLAWARARVQGGDLALRSELFEVFPEDLLHNPAWLSPALVGASPGAAGSDESTDTLYAEMLERSAAADILVVNHHLLALHLLTPLLWEPGRPVFIVVDEADRLPDVVEQLDRTRIPLRLMMSALDAMVVPGASLAAEAVAAIADLVGQFTARIAGGGDLLSIHLLGNAERAQLADRLRILHGLLARCLDETRGKGRQSLIDRERLMELDRFATDTDRFIDVLTSGTAGRGFLYTSPVRGYPGLGSITSGAARRVANRLWRENDDVEALVFTSATLSTLAGAEGLDVQRALFGFYRDVGFESSEVPDGACAVISPEDFGQMHFVLPALTAPLPFTDPGEDDQVEVSPEAIAYWKAMILQAAARGGRVLVLLPSYRDVRLLAGLEADLEDRLLVQAPGVLTGAMVARFLARPDSVWLSAVVWEGLSLPGAISHIVIPRLPMPPETLEDRMLEAYLESIGQKASVGRSKTTARRLAATRRRLRQGIGRGIRAHDDAVTVWLGDARWPLRQSEIDDLLLDQPKPWSATMINAIPPRFRSRLDLAPRLET
ncbi:hypothetical protein LAZ40_00865 [Cereibacter sphaeroides]|uniref:helicase C-terminal domain-containing protein n=1 Tax=Cereibacter sphaeroides TaxID=1063 RepID=UPI001F1CA9E5|nr:helicase C-terminal domain-containing protein [Cereibacter sphaeroides]MCE6957621.1 hypothetical protein [Cereibacter sphaeroides]MCE6971279.1 hypothetical protein [Cereibacter sphaeroides]